MEIIDCEQIFALFDVDVVSGRLFWRQPPRNHPRLLGREAGCAIPAHQGKSYWTVRIGGKGIKRSRLIWTAGTGLAPADCIDHVNGNSLDDRLANLREATVLQNAWNHKKRRRRIALPMGVRLANSGRYIARLGFMGEQITIGTFDTIAAAEAAYRAKRKEMFGEFA